MQNPKQLVLISTSFPDQNSLESNFLNPELPQLLQRFDKVHLLPCKSATSPPAQLPEGAILHTDLAKRLGFPAKHKLLQHVVSGLKARREFPCNTSEPAFPSYRGLANYANLGMARIVHQRLEEGIRNNTWPLEQTVFYSYWCKYSALGIAWTKQKHPELEAVARAHRGDLYANHAPYRLITRQAEILDGMNRVYPISDDGALYLKEHFPECSSKIEVARLGTSKPPRRTQPSTDGTIRLVSCSRASPVKRLNHIAKAMIQLASHGDRAVEWTHFGGGSELDAARAYIASNAPVNLQCTFKGNQSFEVIMDHYMHQPCDVFINASRSEGIPVSMMEAMSTGIPCVAPSVGGIPELLEDDSGGALVSPQATADELAQACLLICENAKVWENRSDLAYTKWATHYDAETNFRAFADSLAEL